MGVCGNTALQNLAPLCQASSSFVGGEGARLFTPYGGSCSRLADGHTVGVFSSSSTIVEVCPEGEVVQKVKFWQGPAPVGQILFVRVLEPYALALGTTGTHQPGSE